MEIRLPHRYQDVRLGQMQAYMQADNDAERIAALADVPCSTVRELPHKLYDRLHKQVALIMQNESSLFERVITLDGREFGLIPDWGEFTLGEWIDTEEMVQDVWSNAHKLMALLYRPVTNRVGDRYDIAKYTGKENHKLFLDVTIDIFAGAMLFFWTSNKTRELILQRSSMEELEEEKQES